VFASEIGESMCANMVAHEADVYLRFLRLQLFIDLHSPLDGKLVHRSLSMFNHHTHSSGYFFKTLLRAVHLSLVTHSVLVFVKTL